MKAIDHGIDFIHGETREQSAEVLKHAQAKSTLMTMRMAEGQLKSWTSLITTLDDLCDATLMSLKDGHRPSTLISTWQIDYWYARVTKKFNLLETLQSSSKFLVHLSKFVLLTLFIKDIRRCLSLSVSRSQVWHLFLWLKPSNSTLSKWEKRGCIRRV